MTATTTDQSKTDHEMRATPNSQLPGAAFAGNEDGSEGVLHEVFAAQAHRHPDAVALRSAGAEVTYAHLDQRANRLAQQLIAAGTRPGDVVALYLERSVEAVVALLAILKAGAAYLALDPRNPPHRQRGTVEDARVSILLTVAKHADEVPDVPTVILLDTAHEAIEAGPGSEPGVPVRPDAAAYVAYTSGSTGTPKGACVPHRAVTRLVIDPDYLVIAGDDVFMLFAPLAFDASTMEIWGALCNGCVLVVHPPGEPSLRELAAAVRREGVTVLWLTAGLFHQMAEGPIAQLSTLRVLLAGGDVLSVAHVNRALAALPGVRLVNGYGPTENTTFTCCQQITEALDGPVPIGRPIRGTRAYVLDAELRPVDVGEVGELYAGGMGVALGYLNRRALTAERFVPDPFTSQPGRRMYRTGDLVRWRPDGALDFLGRADKQLKIRGFRIEPGEIESILTQSDAVNDSAVVGQPMPGGGKVLAAFVVPVPGETVSVLELRERLCARLPSYSVPSSITVLDALPLNVNGKVDRPALESRRGSGRPTDLDTAYRPADGPVSEAISALFSSVLGIDGIGLDDDFFQLGGHSLLAVRIIEELKARYAVDVALREFYLEPTIAGLTTAVTVLPSTREG
jgi:amino acid adenylation domain-containing protein